MVRGKESSDMWRNWVIGILVVVVLVMLFYKPGILLQSPEETEASAELEICDSEDPVAQSAFQKCMDDAGKKAENAENACDATLEAGLKACRDRFSNAYDTAEALRDTAKRLCCLPAPTGLTFWSHSNQGGGCIYRDGNGNSVSGSSSPAIEACMQVADDGFDTDLDTALKILFTCEETANVAHGTCTQTYLTQYQLDVIACSNKYCDKK